MNKFADALGLHKSATFNATVTIHELTQVPLLNAKFRIKWKFKGAKTSSHTGVETPAEDAESGHSHRIGHGLASRWLHPRSALSSSTSVNGISSKASSEQRHRSPSGSGSGSRFDRSSSDDDDLDDISDPPSSPPTRNGALAPLSGAGAANDPGRTPNPNRTAGASFASPFASSAERNVEALYAGSSLSPEQSNERDAAGGPNSARRRGMSEVSLTTSPTSPSQSRSRAITGLGPEPRGQTAVVSLRSHTATFNREVTCPVSISLRYGTADSKKYHLQPSPVRLSIRQQNMGEEHKLEEEKLGEVVLDLSQFVPRHGRPSDLAKPRRYLLQGCKSNAVLRVSVKMEWLEGAHDYVAPQLKSGQMSNSSSSGLKALAGLSSSPASRSAISLGKGSQNQGSTTRLSISNNSVASSTISPSMSRTNSMSSQISSQSATRSTPSPEQQRTQPSRSKKKGWHPPHSALTSAAVPMILGSCGTSHVNDQRTAPEIIDALFNRVASPVRTDWRDSKPSQGGPLGEPFDYRPAGPSREPSVRTETSANGNSAGGRFRRARKAWSVRSGKNGKGGGPPSTAPAATASTQSAHVQADFDRDDPEIPTAASYAQTEAPAERKRQKERDGFLHDVTHDLGARWKAKRQGSADSSTSTGANHGVPATASHRTPRASSEKPRLSIRTATPLRRTDSTSSSTETEHVKSQPLLGAPVAVPPPRRPSLPASASSRPVSIRWGDQDGDREVQRRPSHSSLTAALPRSILGLGLTEETAARAAERPHEAQDRPASAISFESLVTPPSPAA